MNCGSFIICFALLCLITVIIGLINETIDACFLVQRGKKGEWLMFVIKIFKGGEGNSEWNTRE